MRTKICHNDVDSAVKSARRHFASMVMGTSTMGENIPPTPPNEDFDLEQYMKNTSRSHRLLRRREEIEELPSVSQETVWNGFIYEPKLMVHNGEWKIAVNWEQNTNSYSGAGKLFRVLHVLNDADGFKSVAMLIYGDSKMWFWVRIQHLQFLEQVLKNVKHPRHELYQSLNSERSGSNNFNLEERLNIPDCWVDHL
jgi:hypothetical protein